MKYDKTYISNQQALDKIKSLRDDAPWIEEHCYDMAQELIEHFIYLEKSEQGFLDIFDIRIDDCFCVNDNALHIDVDFSYLENNYANCEDITISINGNNYKEILLDNHPIFTKLKRNLIPLITLVDFHPINIFTPEPSVDQHRAAYRKFLLEQIYNSMYAHSNKTGQELIQLLHDEDQEPFEKIISFNDFKDRYSPYLNSPHDGDCTRVAASCMRCCAEELYDIPSTVIWEPEDAVFLAQSYKQYLKRSINE